MQVWQREAFGPLLVMLLMALWLALHGQQAYAQEYYLTDFSEVSYEQAPALQLTFTDSIAPDTDLSDFVTLSPEPDQGSQWMPLNDGKTWVLPFVKASTAYKVRVSNRLKSVSGASLSAREANSSAEEAEYPLARKLVTRSYDASVSFASQGNFISADLAAGLPVSVLNVPEVQLQVFHITDEQAFLNQLYRSQGFEGVVDYYNLDTLHEAAELAYTGQFPIEARQNQRKTLNLDISAVIKRYSKGIFVAVVRDPRRFNYGYSTTFFALTDIGLQVRKLDQQLVAFSHSLTTAEPKADVALEFVYRDRDRLASSGKTNEDGIFQHVFDQLPSYVVAKKGDEIAFLNLDYSGLDLSDYNNANVLHQPAQAFMYAPRDLYRPGDTVNINILLRDYDGQQMPKQSLQLTLLDARGQEVVSQTRSEDETGLVQFEYQLPDTAYMGSWSLRVSSKGLQLNESYHFKVEDFLPETLALTFYDGDKTVRRRVFPDQVNVPIKADYLYGAPAAGNQADALVTVRAAQTIFEQYPDTVFGDEQYQPKRSYVNLPRQTLDEQGKGTLNIPDDWSDAPVPLELTVAASVYESGGRPITRRQNVVRMTSAERLPGIKALSDLPAEEDQQVTFQLRSVTPTGEPSADHLKLKLYRYGWNYHWEYNPSRGWYREYVDDPTLVDLSRLDVTKDGVEKSFQLEWGRYYLEAQSDSGAVARYYFRTTGSWWYGSERSQNIKPSHIDIGLNRDQYTPGDNATLLVDAPFAAQARLTVESSDGLEHIETVTLKKGENEVALALDEHWNRHDLYVTLMALNAADQVTELAPERALGIIHLPILRRDAVAEVTLSVPERTEPNGPINAQIQVTNHDQLGKQPLYATVALVDRGVLNITGFQPPNPQRFFYGQRRYETDIYDTYDDIINNLGLDSVRQRFGGDMFEVAAAEDDLTRGGEQPKSDVQIVSLLSKPVALENGSAEVSFNLPNFNGRLEWMVVVYGQKSYGNATQQTIVADKVVTQASMPRFLGMGDHSQLTFDVHNISGKDQTLEVNTWVEGPLTAETQQQTLTLKDGAKRVVTLPITGGEREGLATVRMTVRNDSDINIDRTWHLGVRSPFTWPLRSSYAILDPESEWQPEFSVGDLRPETVSGFLTVSNRPALNFSAYLEYLLQYPYGCLEQTASSTYPWLLMDEQVVESYQLQTHVNRLLEQDMSPALRAEQLQEGLLRLYKKQHSNGSFGYWDRDSQESRWGTVYATELMVDARKSGYPVDDGALSRALSRLTMYLKQQNAGMGWSDSPSYAEFSYRAYAAYVLAKANNVSLADVRRLYTQVDEQALSESGLGWMYLAAAFDLLKDQQRADQSYTKAWQFERSEQRYYQDYGSRIRDFAMKLVLAGEMERDASEHFQRLQTLLQEDRWLSTQDRIALLRLASQWTQTDAFEFTWLTNDGAKTEQATQSQRYQLTTQNMAALEGIESGKQRLFVSSIYQGAPQTALPESSQGIQVTREYYHLDGNKIALDNVKSGDLIVASAVLEATESHVNDALYVDLFPAGLEPENQNLGNASVQLNDLEIDHVNLDSYFQYGAPVQYEAYQDDRYVAALRLEKGEQVRLFYLLRAVTPGRYQVPNAMAEDMYRPAIQGNSAALEDMVIQANTP